MLVIITSWTHRQAPLSWLNTFAGWCCREGTGESGGGGELLLELLSLASQLVSEQKANRAAGHRPCSSPSDGRQQKGGVGSSSMPREEDSSRGKAAGSRPPASAAAAQPANDQSRS